jgi:hypothetical protein
MSKLQRWIWKNTVTKCMTFRFQLKTYTVIISHINDIRSQSKCNLSYRPCVYVRKLKHIIVIFCIWHDAVFIKLKNNKIVFGFSHTQLCILFLSWHVSVNWSSSLMFTKFRIDACSEVAFMQYGIPLLLLFIIFSGSAAQRGLWPPRSRSFVITHDAPQSVGTLWMSDQFVAETSTDNTPNTQHTQQTSMPRFDSNPQPQ